ncbi:MAG: ATP-binding protein [Candidatus Parcubacteria bacterium]|nr:ATP-binding protein [Candidatus Parcubacteria bacterium]
MYIFTISGSIISIICIGISIFISFKKSSEILGKLLSFNFLFIGVWLGANVLADISKTSWVLVFWSGIAVIATSSFVGFYLSFIERFLNNKPINKIKLLVFFSPLIFNIFFAFTKYNVEETYFYANAPAEIKPGFLYWLAPVIVFGILFYGVFKLYREYNRQTLNKKMQIRYMQLGFFLTIVGATIFVFILPILGIYKYYNLGPQFSIFLIGLTAYTILRHKLLDIRIILQRSIVYTLIFSMFFIVYISFIYVFEKTFSLISLGKTLSSIISVAVLIIIYPHFKLYFQKKTDKFFYRYPYDAALVLKEINKECSNQIDFDDFFINFVRVIEEKLNINKVLLVILSNDKKPIIVKNHNFSSKLSDFFKTVECPSELYEYFNKFKNPALVRGNDKILENILNDEELMRRQELFEKFGVNLILPVYSNDRLTAFFFFGGKLSDEDYYPQDLQLFDSLVDIISLAFKNINLYNELKKYTKSLESKVQERTEELQVQHENQIRFTADISHELQTPLAILKGNFSLINQKKITQEEMEKGFARMERSVDRLSDIIKDLIFLTKADAGKIPVNKEKFNLSQVVKAVYDDSYILAEDKNIDFELEILNEIIISADEEKIKSLLFNLISNALKFTQAGKKIKITLSEFFNNAYVLVEDEGIGIASKDQPNIFSRFYRIDNQDSPKGSGLGLAICEWIVHAHGGEISVKSVLEQGTIFKVVLPIK